MGPLAPPRHVICDGGDLGPSTKRAPRHPSGRRRLEGDGGARQQDARKSRVPEPCQEGRRGGRQLIERFSRVAPRKTRSASTASTCISMPMTRSHALRIRTSSARRSKTAAAQHRDRCVSRAPLVHVGTLSAKEFGSPILLWICLTGGRQKLPLSRQRSGSCARLT